MTEQYILDQYSEEIDELAKKIYVKILINKDDFTHHKDPKELTRLAYKYAKSFIIEKYTQNNKDVESLNKKDWDFILNIDNRLRQDKKIEAIQNNYLIIKRKQ